MSWPSDRASRDLGSVAARRRALLLMAPALLAAGLAARFGLSGGLADGAGGIAYTAMVYLLVALVRPMAPPIRVGLVALAFSVAVELFQLTSFPQSLSDAFGPTRLVLGTSFAATDLPPYVIGAVLAATVDLAARRAADRPS